MFTIYINDLDVCANKLKISRRPSFHAPLRNYETYEIKGKSGSLYEDLNTYSDIEISIEFNYICNQEIWNEVFRECKKTFLNCGGKRLSFSDDETYYYKIKRAIMEENKRESIVSGSFVVRFTLDPFSYLLHGLQKTKILLFQNEYEVSFPTYFIKGEGMCSLNVNGNIMSVNVGQNLVIDTYLQQSYKNDGTSQNTNVLGNYHDLLLLEGTNRISITQGFSLSIMPNWRTL